MIPRAAAKDVGIETDGSTLSASDGANGPGRIKTQEMHCHAEDFRMV